MSREIQGIGLTFRRRLAIGENMGASRATALAALKIGGRVAFERLVRPKARRGDDVPCSPNAITIEWLTAVLCSQIPGTAVTNVHVAPASSGTHERHRLLLTYNDAGQRAGLPASIFTKSLPSVVTFLATHITALGIVTLINYSPTPDVVMRMFVGTCAITFGIGATLTGLAITLTKVLIPRGANSPYGQC
jgi:hypothetical protein